MRIAIALCLILGLYSKTLFAILDSDKARMEQADDAYRHREVELNAQNALEGYEWLFSKYPNDPTVAWKYSMANYLIGQRYRTSSEEKKLVFSQGMEAGQKAISLDPDCGPCHFWTAVNTALYGQEVGAFRALFLLKKILNHLESTVALDPGYAYGGAYRILALIHQRLPGILGGDNDKAKEYFLKAIEVAPDEPLNYFQLARLLQEEFKDRKQALKFVDEALRLPVPSAERMESKESLTELAQLRQELLSEQTR